MPREADAAMDKPCHYSTHRLLIRQLPIRGSPVPLHLIMDKLVSQLNEQIRIFVYLSPFVDGRFF